MNTEYEDKEAIRRGIALIVDESPPAPEICDLTTVSLKPERRSPSRLAVFGAAAAVTVALVGTVFALGSIGGGELGAGGPGGEFERILIQNPDWSVSRYDEFRGQMDTGDFYHHAETTYVAAGGAEVDLNLDTGNQERLDELIAGRRADGTQLADDTAMGAPVNVILYESSSLTAQPVAPAAGAQEDVILDEGAGNKYSAMWRVGNVIYELRGYVEEAQLRGLLADVTEVSEETFLAAMPDTVPTDRESTVDEMLEGIPVPAGFQVTPLYDGDLKDHYQLGAEVTGAVACAWIHQWIAATESGDTRAADEAVDAMDTSRDWDVLVDMQEYGDWPKVVWEYTDAIAGDGTVMGGRLLTVAESVDDALGCQTAN
jgi:hypothetical protein